jgi:hypothetical protein
MNDVTEVALPGGNVGGVVGVGVGDTVRRPTGPWTPAVHAPEYAAARVTLMAEAYGGDVTPLEILHGAPVRAQRSARVIRVGQEAGRRSIGGPAGRAEPGSGRLDPVPEFRPSAPGFRR